MNIDHDAFFLPFGDQFDEEDPSPATQQCALKLYRQAWEKYRAVGCPYGLTDRAMLVWYSFQDGPRRPSLVFGKN